MLEASPTCYRKNHSKGGYVSRGRPVETWTWYSCSLAKLFLFLTGIVLLGAASAQGVTSRPSYVLESNVNDVDGRVSETLRCSIKKDDAARRLYIKNKEHRITILTSKRISHRVLSAVVMLFIKEQLGYINVSVVETENMYAKNIIEQIGIKSGSNATNPGMINMEVWVPPGYAQEDLMPLTSFSYLGIGGRVGWFFPRELIQATDMVDHWRVFDSPNKYASQLFSRSEAELNTLIPLRKDNSTNAFYCSDPRCIKGIFTPKHCYSKRCSLIFASYFGASEFLIDQINEMKLYVKVAWLGPNLNSEFVNNELARSSANKSVLIFHWIPDLSMQRFNLTSISFPGCTDSEADEFVPYLCKYEMHRSHKFIWTGLNVIDSYLYESLEKIHFSLDMYKSLYEVYKNHKSLPINVIACNWMKQNKDTWSVWLNGDGLPSLYLIGMFPIHRAEGGEGDGFLDPGSVRAFMMGIESVNNASLSPVVSNYRIVPKIIDTSCEPSKVMKEFINIIKTSTLDGTYRKIIGIVGPACSDTVEPIAGVSKFVKMPIISYGAEGAVFSDRSRYPYFFRTIPENRIFRYVYLKLCKSLNWKHIGALTESGHQYSEYLTSLLDLLQDNDFSFNLRKYPQERAAGSNIVKYVTEIKENGYHIIIGDFYEKMAQQVMCEAFHLQMTGRQGYVWFLPGWFSPDWYNTSNILNADGSRFSCSTEDMAEALEGHMTLTYKYYGNDNQLIPDGRTVLEWKNDYLRGLRAPIKPSNYSGFTYDAVMTYAFALQKMFSESQQYTSDLRSDKTIERFVHYINRTDFNGVSGRVTFNQGPSRVTDVIVWQFTNRQYVKVAYYKPHPTDNSKGDFDVYTHKLVWPTLTGSMPTDGNKVCVIENFRLLLGDTDCNTALIVLCSIIFGLLAIVLMIIILMVRQRYELKLRMLEEMWENQALNKNLQEWELSRSKVVINRKLGEGAFGTVYGGECLVDNQGWRAVAVKTLKVGSTMSEKLDFLFEAEMMKNLCHENIVDLLGVCTESEPLYTVMEFMLYGDLKTYLLARRHLVNEKNRMEDDEVSNRRLTSMAKDVAKALEYLDKMKFVHRDVACRNCLVNSHRLVKLGDFGMTRYMNEKEYYRFNRKGLLPIRWMAPETVTVGIFTPMSDVWSYGVLLYEIITFGAFPFQGFKNDQVFEKVKNGETPTIPVGIKSGLVYLLKECWNIDPQKRISASDIVLHLEKNPLLLSPSLEGPQSSVTIENPVGLELMADKNRKLSLALHQKNNSQSLLLHQSSYPNRKRSMSGNMTLNIPPLHSSFSEDGIVAISSNLDALNLNQVIIRDDRDDDDGHDPLLSPARYISSRIISRELWTNITPV